MKINQNWLSSGMMLGIAFLAAIWLIKPVGVSTQFVIVDGIVWNTFSPKLITEAEDGTIESTNAYLNKGGGKYASLIKKPFNYGLVFVVFMIFGGFLSGRFSKHSVIIGHRFYPKVWRRRFGESKKKRYWIVFLSGFIVLFGARLAGGCTSGHMMSGMMQTSLSGYLFAAGAFATAIPVSIFLFKPKKK